MSKKNVWTFIFDKSSPYWKDDMEYNKELIISYRERFTQSRRMGWNLQITDFFIYLGLDTPDEFPTFKHADIVSMSWHDDVDKIVIHFKW